MKLANEEFVLAAIAYAAKRWALDDPALIREYCETPRHEDDTPESLMEDLGRRYDLIDADSDLFPHIKRKT